MRLTAFLRLLRMRASRRKQRRFVRHLQRLTRTPFQRESQFEMAKRPRF